MGGLSGNPQVGAATDSILAPATRMSNPGAGTAVPRKSHTCGWCRPCHAAHHEASPPPAPNMPKRVAAAAPELSSINSRQTKWRPLAGAPILCMTPIVDPKLTQRAFQGVVSSTNARPCRGWSGRLLPTCTASKAAICDADSSMGVVMTSQLTPSLHGGVVSEPG